MRRQVPDLLRLCPRLFFELMDVQALLEGNTETRSRDAFVKMAPVLHPLAGTEGIARIVFDELVADVEDKEEISRERFEQYLDAMYKREFATNYAEQWSAIRQQCGLLPSEKCILYTPYAPDCSPVCTRAPTVFGFPPARCPVAAGFRRRRALSCSCETRASCARAQCLGVCMHARHSNNCLHVVLCMRASAPRVCSAVLAAD